MSVSDFVEFSARFMTAAGAEHACRVRCTSLDDVVLGGALVPAIGDHIVCRVDGLGTLHGSAGEATREGFRFVLHAGPLQRDRLAGRLRWHRARAAGRDDPRDGERVVPMRPDVSVTWSGSEAAGLLRDVSVSGAAIDLDPQPAVGTALTVGCRRATVVRHTERGVGVRFSLPLRPEDVREDMCL